MQTLKGKICSLDTSMFSAILSETSEDDKRSLLLLQDCVRSRGDYIYLEIGSHLGGTIQPYYVDPLCTLIYSIDKRPEFQLDERGRLYRYTDNSTKKMLENLSCAFPSVDRNKVRAFDSESRRLDSSKIKEKPNICFIDGEHTTQAVFSDFKFCLKVCHSNSIIVFHDTCYVFEGIKKIKKYLSNKSIPFCGFMLEGSVYSILLNEAIGAYSGKIKTYSKNEEDYFRKSSEILLEIRRENRKDKIGMIKDVIRKHPRLYQFCCFIKRFL